MQVTHLVLKVRHLLLYGIACIAALSAMTTLEHCVITQLLLQVSHILIVVEPWCCYSVNLSLFVNRLRYDVLLAVIKLATWTQALISLYILHLQVWTRGVWRIQTIGLLRLVLMLLIVNEHL